MSAHHRRREPETMSTADFLDMIRVCPEDERWQLIDGTPLMMMTPPTMIHQKIASNLARRLDQAFDVHRPDLCALVELGLLVEHIEDFRPIADVAVVDQEVLDLHYAPRFYLAAEILSNSNTQEYISRKRRYYSEVPSCLYVLIIKQDEICAEVWSRALDWQGRVFRSENDVIELAEFGFSCRLGDLYRGTPVT